MSTNIGHLNRDCIAANYQIGSKIVIDRNCNLIAHNARIKGDERVDGDLTVRGNTAFTNVSASGKLTTDQLCVTGDAMILGNVSFDTGVINIQGNCIVASDATTQVCVTPGRIDLIGDTDVTGDLTVNGLPIGGGSGMSIKKIPFSYNTANIVTGAPLYTPVAGEVFYDGWISVDTPWNNGPAFADIGLLSSGKVGLISQMKTTYNGNETNINMTVPMYSTTNPLSISNTGLSYNRYSGKANNVTLGHQWFSWYFVFSAPYIFVSSDPVCVCVNTTGTAGLPATIGFNFLFGYNPIITLGVNDQFSFVTNGSPETFTVLPGTYVSRESMTEAMAGAIGSISGQPFGTFMFVFSYSPYLRFQAYSLDLTAPGYYQLQNVVGRDFLLSMASGVGPYLSTAGIGPGANTGATEGQGHLYLVTSMPIVPT